MSGLPCVRVSLDASEHDLRNKDIIDVPYTIASGDASRIVSTSLSPKVLRIFGAVQRSLYFVRFSRM